MQCKWCVVIENSLGEFIVDRLNRHPYSEYGLNSFFSKEEAEAVKDKFNAILQISHRKKLKLIQSIKRDMELLNEEDSKRAISLRKGGMSLQNIKKELKCSFRAVDVALKGMTGEDAELYRQSKWNKVKERNSVYKRKQ